MTDLRLRQVALVARSLDVADDLRADLRLGEPFADPGIAQFGLVNAVFAVGSDFLEVVTPAQEGTAAGRHLDRMGGDGGYMAIFQVPDIGAARSRVADLGVRVVWQHDLDAVGGTHLHPRDVPGAIVSLDWAEPPGSWGWAGPAWMGRVPDHRPGGVAGITVAGGDPASVRGRWAAVLGVPAAGGNELRIAGGTQVLRFEAGGGQPRITAVQLRLPTEAVAGRQRTEVGGVRIDLEPAG